MRTHLIEILLSAYSSQRRSVWDSMLKLFEPEKELCSERTSMINRAKTSSLKLTGSWSCAEKFARFHKSFCLTQSFFHISAPHKYHYCTAFSRIEIFQTDIQNEQMAPSSWRDGPAGAVQRLLHAKLAQLQPSCKFVWLTFRENMSVKGVSYNGPIFTPNRPRDFSEVCSKNEPTRSSQRYLCPLRPANNTVAAYQLVWEPSVASRCAACIEKH